MNTPSRLPRLLRVEDAAEILGVSTKTIHRWRQTGALLSHSGFILKIQCDPLARMRLRCRLQRAWQPLFTQASCAWGSDFGCTCRAFCRENPIRRSILLRLAGW